MLALYLFCAALGMPLLALFAFSSGDGDAELGDAGFDVDADIGGEIGTDLDFGAAHGGLGDFTGLLRRVPVSSYAFFLSFFGGAGTLGTWLDVGFIQTIILAVTLGVIAASVNTAAFSFLRNTDASSQLTDPQLEGRVATVSVPIDAGKRGRVWLDTGDERVQLTAGSIEAAIDRSFERGEQVVIVAMENGIAKVMGIDPELSD
jgi:membrane protein implicated in regulation of membrane protease activity